MQAASLRENRRRDALTKTRANQDLFRSLLIRIVGCKKTKAGKIALGAETTLVCCLRKKLGRDQP